MKLYYSPAACSLAAHIVADEAGIPVELKRVVLKTHTTEDGDYRVVNPKGYVPALMLDDGRLLTEVSAIMQYLADLRPEAKLAPPPATFERYRLQEWLSFISTELHKNFRPLIRGAAEATMNEARQRILDRLGFIEGGLEGDYLMGKTFTAADAYLFVILTWVKMVKLDMSTRLTSYRNRILLRPKVQAAMRAEGLTFTVPAS